MIIADNRCTPLSIIKTLSNKPLHFWSFYNIHAITSPGRCCKYVDTNKTSDGFLFDRKSKKTHQYCFFGRGENVAAKCRPKIGQKEECQQRLWYSDKKAED